MNRRNWLTTGVWRLRMLLGAIFLALSIPTAVLFVHSYGQLKWEAFHQHRLLAEALLTRIDQRYGELIDIENARAFTDYAFLSVAGGTDATVVERSVLSKLPVDSATAGTLGYFQIDHLGRFTTPLVPADETIARRQGVAAEELQRRRALRDTLLAVLSDNRLVVTSADRDAEKKTEAVAEDSESDDSLLDSVRRDRQPAAAAGAGAVSESTVPSAPEERAQAGFDALTSGVSSAAGARAPKSAQGLGRLADLQLEREYASQAAAQEQRARTNQSSDTRQKRKVSRTTRKEQNIALEEAAPGELARSARVSMFESDIDPLRFSLLDSGHFVLYRNVWRDEQRYIQGLLIDAAAFVDQVIGDAFYQDRVSQSSSLAVAWRGNVIRAFGSREGDYRMSGSSDLSGTLLLQRPLSDPLGGMEVVFSVDQLPAGPGGSVLAWTGLVLMIVFGGGFVLLYRLGRHQIEIARQQQDFVSAVSHELKTPLTSIRMYGEMLRAGWATEEKRKTYYDYILDESERLTRLINNVLQLARMSRNDLQVELRACTIEQLIDTLHSKVGSQIERAGFTLEVTCADELSKRSVEVDADCFTQIMINLVDNALKFSAGAERSQIDIDWQLERGGKISVSVRDYGQGIARDQLRKIFKLFYRAENELTRETVGTGIGLALVRELATAMRGEIDAMNADPGARFRVTFPLL